VSQIRKFLYYHVIRIAKIARKVKTVNSDITNNARLKFKILDKTLCF